MDVDIFSTLEPAGIVFGHGGAHELHEVVDVLSGPAFHVTADAELLRLVTHHARFAEELLASFGLRIGIDAVLHRGRAFLGHERMRHADDDAKNGQNTEKSLHFLLQQVRPEE